MKADFILPASVTLALLAHVAVLMTGIHHKAPVQSDPVRIAVRFAAALENTVKPLPESTITPPPKASLERKAEPRPEDVGLKKAAVKPHEPEQVRIPDPVPPPQQKVQKVEEQTRLDPVVKSPLSLPHPVVEPVPATSPALAAHSQLQPASNTVDENRLRDMYLALISARLQERKIYPVLARRRGMEGEATLRIAIGAEGQIISYLLEESSGHDVLDQAVRDMIKGIGSFPAPPAISSDGAMECRVPIRFNLHTG
jgi:protein TonB